MKIDFASLADGFGCSIRHLRRIKNDLEKLGHLRFRTMNRADGRGQQVICALTSRLKFDKEPLLRSVDGRDRHVKTRIDGIPIQSLVVVMAVNPNRSGDMSVLPILAEQITPRLGDIPYRREFSNENQQGGPPPSPGSGIQPRKDRGTPTPKQIGLAHVLKRQLEPMHWDNCKVEFSLAHAFGYCWRSLAAGFDQGSVLSAYDQALHRRHADATDHGLNEGNPRLKWCASSTVSLALALLRTNFAAKNRNNCDNVTIESHGSNRKSEQAMENQGYNVTLKRGNYATYLARRIKRDDPLEPPCPSPSAFARRLHG